MFSTSPRDRAPPCFSLFVQKRGSDMQSIGIVTDTNSGMTQAEARDCGVILMSMPFTVNGRNYVENVNMSYMEFFAHLQDGADVATSQPSPEDVTTCWKKALESFEKIVYIPMSSALSSSCQSAKLFAEDFGGRVLVADNRRISISQKQSVYDALRWRDQGLSAEEILKNLTDTALEASIYLTVNDLKYLKKGGRITPSVAAIATRAEGAAAHRLHRRRRHRPGLERPGPGALPPVQRHRRRPAHQHRLPRRPRRARAGIDEGILT